MNCLPILLIRPDRNESDATALAQVGVPSLIAPLLHTVPVADATAARGLSQELAEAGEQTWLVVTSPRTWGLWRRLVADLDTWLAAGLAGGLRVATVGTATTASLPEQARAIARTSEGVAAEDLLEWLAAQPAGLALLPASALARGVLPNGLRAAGWQVHDVAIYHTQPVESAPPALAGLAAGGFSGVLVRSPSAADALARLAPDLGVTTVFAAGPISAARCRGHGWQVVELPVTDPRSVADRIGLHLLPRLTSSPNDRA